MSIEDEIVSENPIRNRDHASIPLNEGAEPHLTETIGENIPRNSSHQICTIITVLKDWWKCTSVITKVKLLGFVFLPCLAIGLYIFHYTQHPGSLHNPIAVLHPFTVVHPLIPTPFKSTIKFIEEKTKGILSNSVEVSVLTKKGTVVGRRVSPNPASDVHYDSFLGIPYGKIPSRFQRAVSPNSWASPRYTQSDGPACPQPGIAFDEDCLLINVFTPKGAVDLATGFYPVMVFIHDSGFTWSSSSYEHYGPDFLVPKGVILVTFNYRVGALGFLTLGSQIAPGNMGLFDTELALRWVQDEIHSFGGDPGQVTLMGQGAGAVLAMYHYLSPASQGLFRRVIAQSGSALAGWGHYTAEEGAARTKALATAVGCDSLANDTQLLTCLARTNITRLVDSQSIPLAPRFLASGETMRFLPVLDTHFADKPFFTDTLINWMERAVNRSIPLMTGFTADEGMVKLAEDECWEIVEANLDSFIPSSIYSLLGSQHKAALVRRIKSHYFPNSITNNKVLDIVRILQDNMIVVPILKITQKLSNSSYGYMFDFTGPWTPDPAYITRFHLSGVNHGYDLRYLFYNRDNPQDLENCSSLRDSLSVRDMMINWWTSFAKTGTPGIGWPKVSEGGFLRIGPNTSLINAETLENDHNYGFWLSLETETVWDESAANFAKLNFFAFIVVLLWNFLVTKISSA